MKLTDKAESTTQTVLLFGPPKSGKTLLAGKLAEHFKLIWFDLENGYITLTQLPVAWQENIEVISLPDTRDFPIAIETIMKVFQGRAVNICEQHGKVDCKLCAKDNKPTVRVCLSELRNDTIVVLDSITQLTSSVIARIAPADNIDYKFEFDDYRRMGAHLDSVLSRIQNATYNVICISHETEVEMEDGKKKLVPTAGTANFSRNTAKYFAHVVYVEVKNRAHKAASSTTFAHNILTGSRTSAVMEGDAVASLLRIFKPELFPEVVVTQAQSPVTPGGVSSNNLAALRAKMAASKAK